jgi:hypothetical protein
MGSIMGVLSTNPMHMLLVWLVVGLEEAMKHIYIFLLDPVNDGVLEIMECDVGLMNMGVDTL